MLARNAQPALSRLLCSRHVHVPSAGGSSIRLAMLSQCATSRLGSLTSRSCQISSFSARQLTPRQVAHRSLGRGMSSFLPSGGDDQQIIIGLIGLNAAFFGAWALLDYRQQMSMAENCFVSTVGIFEHLKLHNLILANFTHVNIVPAAINSLVLWFIGGDALRVLGRQRFLLLYVGGGAFAQLCQAAFPAGAQGSLSALVTWAVLMWPTRTFLIYFVFPVPATLLGALYVGKDLLGLYRGYAGTAPRSLGGAAAGAAVFVMTRGRGGGGGRGFYRYH